MTTPKNTSDLSKSSITKWTLLVITLVVVQIAAQDISLVSAGIAHGKKTYIVAQENGDNIFLSDELNCSSENIDCRETFAAPYRVRAVHTFDFHLPFAKRLAAGNVEFDTEAKAVICFLGNSSC